MKGMSGNGGPKKSKVSMTCVGNVKKGAYSAAENGKALGAYNGKFPPAKRLVGSHRKTLSVGKVKGHHRSG